MLQRFTYIFFRVIVFLFRFLPFWLVYKVSDFIYWVLYYILGYRKNTVLANLKKAFPNKKQHEIERICRQFYRHFCDLLVESFKGFSMSKSDLQKRFKITNPALANAYAANNQSLIVVGSHFANWEWGVMCVNTQVRQPLTGIYRPVANKYINDYFVGSRTRFGMNLSPIGNTRDTFEANENHTFAMIMMADQSPGKIEKAYWLTFMGLDTPCHYGPEKYAVKYNYPVMYFSPVRVRRGFYECELVLLAENPSKQEEGDITKAFMQYLEKQIYQYPEQWLWTHRRWKKAHLKPK